MYIQSALCCSTMESIYSEESKLVYEIITFCWNTTFSKLFSPGFVLTKKCWSQCLAHVSFTTRERVSWYLGAVTTQHTIRTSSSPARVWNCHFYLPYFLFLFFSFPVRSRDKWRDNWCLHMQWLTKAAFYGGILLPCSLRRLVNLSPQLNCFSLPYRSPSVTILGI